MPYILPSDTRERTLGNGLVRRRPYVAGDYINQRFVLPTNSLSGDYRRRRMLSGGMVSEVYARPPYRSLGSWFDEQMIAGVPNTYLAAGGALLAVLLLSGKRR